MAKWRRGGRRAAVQDNSWWVPRAMRGSDDGATVAGEVGGGVRCDQPVAASAELASCAPVVVEAAAAQEGEAGRIVSCCEVLGYLIPLAGCQAHACLIRRPCRQAHNGPCRCLDHVRRDDALAVRRELAVRGYPMRSGAG